MKTRMTGAAARLTSVAHKAMTALDHWSIPTVQKWMRENPASQEFAASQILSEMHVCGGCE